MFSCFRRGNKRFQRESLGVLQPFFRRQVGLCEFHAHSPNDDMSNPGPGLLCNSPGSVHVCQRERQICFTNPEETKVSKLARDFLNSSF